VIGARYDHQRLRNRMRSRDEQQQRKALVGADGWLFLSNDKNNVLGQHLGRVRLSARRRRAWSRLLEQRMALMRELGSTWLCVIAPDKEAVYPELLPPGMTPAPRRPVHQILAEAERLGAPVFYPLDRLLDAKRRGQPYYQTDTHWNQFGAHAAYLLITDELAKRGIEVPTVAADDVRWIAETALGDLGRKLRPRRGGRSVRAELRTHTSRLVFDNRISNHGRKMVFESDDDGRPDCVAFGESYANHLLLFLKESFRRLTFVHTSMVDRELLERERPEVALTLPLERFMVEVPDDRDAHVKLGRIAAEKRAQGRVRDGTDRFLRGIPSSATAPPR
jgi:alginate O-acetyltransferase complex protein AlgJ